IHVRRKDHQTRTAGTLRLPSQRDTLHRREPRDPRDHGHTVRDRLAARAEDPDLLLPRQRRRLAQRTQGDEALAAMIDQPGRMLLEEAVIDRSIATERSRDRREDPGPVAPVHEDPPKGVSNSAPRTGRRETPAQRRARLGYNMRTGRRPQAAGGAEDAPGHGGGEDAPRRDGDSQPLVSVARDGIYCSESGTVRNGVHG